MAPLFTKQQKLPLPSEPNLREFLRTYKLDLILTIVFVVLLASSASTGNLLLSSVAALVVGFQAGAMPFAYLNKKCLQLLQYISVELRRSAEEIKTKQGK
jgi:predicted branched-subunit amino acid permease